MHIQVQVVSTDVNTMVAIRTASGKLEERTKLLPGETGFAYAIFPSDGTIHRTDVPNLFFSIASKAAQKPKAKAKGKGKAKAKAKGKAPAAASSSDDEETGEEEELEGDEEMGSEADLMEEEEQDAPEAPAPAAALLEEPAIPAPGEDENEDEEPRPKKRKQENCFSFHADPHPVDMRTASIWQILIWNQSSA